MPHPRYALYAGFTLIELLTALFITSLLASSVFMLLIYVQRTNIKVLNTHDVTSKIDAAELFIRSRIGPADRLIFDNSSVSDNDAAGSVECLLIQRRNVRDRTGLSLADNGDYVSSSGYKGIGNKASFALSFWFKRSPAAADNTSGTKTGTESMVSWGAYNVHSASNISIHLLSDGHLRFQFGAEFVDVPSPAKLNDDKWHHLLLSYDGSVSGGAITPATMQTYIDGVQRNMVISSGSIPLLINIASTSDDFTLGRGNTGEIVDNFNGAVSDLRLYSSIIGGADANMLFSSAAHPPSATKALHWNFDTISSNRLVADASPANLDGLLVNSEIANPIFTSSEESFSGDVFAMVDTPLDGNKHYQLLHSATRTSCPDNASDIAAFTPITLDLFTRNAAAGFFSQSNRPLADNLSANILFNYGYSEPDTKQTGTGRAGASSRAQTRKLTMTQKFTHPDLCKATAKIAFSPPPPTGGGGSTCNIRQAFAYIAQDFDNATDELFIQNAQYWADNSTYHSLAFVPDTLYAKWSSETGVMRFYTNDGTALEASVWEDALNQLAYRPTSDNYIAEKKLVISLGYLPLKIGGAYHFYDFVELPLHTQVDWEASRDNASQTKFCGMTAYLATVTSQTENDFLIKKFRKADGSVPAGWLGGSDKAVRGKWVWVDGSPEAGDVFWDEAHGGRPIRTDNITASTSEFVAANISVPGSVPASFKRRLTSKVPGGPQLRFQYFSQNEPNEACPACNGDPNNEPYLQIVGNVAGNGLWNDLPDEPEENAASIHYKCGYENYRYGPCGFYIEFGGHGGHGDNTLNVIVLEKSIDLSKQREFCSPSGK